MYLWYGSTPAHSCQKHSASSHLLAVMASVIQNSKGVLLIDYYISPERFNWAYCPDLMRHLRLAVKDFGWLVVLGLTAL